MGVEGVSSSSVEGVEWVEGGSVVSPFREGVLISVCGGVSAVSSSLGSLLEFCVGSSLSIGRFREMSPDWNGLVMERLRRDIPSHPAKKGRN